MMDKNTVILLCVSVYMLTCIAIGLWAMRRTHSTHDFFMAGRNLGFIVTGVAIFSSIMSGFGFVGGPGLMYTMGLSSIWILIGTPAGIAMAFYLLAKKSRMVAEIRQSMSIPDLAFARYNSPTVRLLVAISILFGVVAYLGVQIKAMAYVLKEIFVNNEIWGHDSMLFCVVISSAVLVFYCVTGGIIASVYTDLFQGIVMVAIAVTIFFSAFGELDGGITACIESVFNDDSESAGPWGAFGMFGCLSWFFLFGVGVVGQPHVISKMMMSKKVEDARHMLPFTLTGYTLTALLWISIGLVMRALVLNGEHPELAKADDAAAEFLYSFASPLLAGLTFAGLFAAIMSTADGFLNIGAAAIVHDIPHAIKGKSINRELLWARIATVGLAVLAGWFALATPDLVGILGVYGWGVFASAMAPAVGIGMNWKRATRKAAIISITLSMAINFIAMLIQLSTGAKLGYGVAPGAIALGVSLISFVGISLLSKPDEIDSDIEQIMDL